MLRLDEARYIVAHIEVDGLTLRFAIPRNWTVEYAAAHAWDSRHSPERRHPKYRHTLLTGLSEIDPMLSVKDMLLEGGLYTVKQWVGET